MTEDELLEVWNEYGYTREECKLLDAGANITLFDDMEELESKTEQFSEWLEQKSDWRLI